MSSTNLEDVQELIRNARHLIDKINDTQKSIEEDQISLENLEDISDEQDSEDKILEYEKKLFPYLTKDNLVLLLRTYKKLVSILNLNDSFKNKHISKDGNIDMNDISINLEKNCNLMTSMDDESHASENILHDIKTILLKSRCQSLSDLTKMEEHENHEEELTKNLIVTNLPNEVFQDSELRMQFENLFLELDHKCQFYYFKSFKRCRIECDDFISALLMKFELEDRPFYNVNLKVFLTQPIKLKNSRPFLEPPKNDKTFLISPPASPPVGWEQDFEDPPVVNYDLLAALSQLNPHEPCELVKSQINIPGIVVHPCTDHVELTPDASGRIKFIQTRRPPNYF